MQEGQMAESSRGIGCFGGLVKILQTEMSLVMLRLSF